MAGTKKRKKSGSFFSTPGAQRIKLSPELRLLELASYLPNSKCLDTQWQKTNSQAHWAFYCSDVVNRSIPLLKKNPNITADTFYTYLAGCRKLLAYKLGHKTAKYGTIRTGCRFHTLIAPSDRYQDQFAPLKSRLKLSTTTDSWDPHRGIGEYYTAALKRLKKIEDEKGFNTAQKFLYTKLSEYENADIAKLNRHLYSTYLNLENGDRQVSQIILVTHWLDYAVLNFTHNRSISMPYHFYLTNIQICFIFHAPVVDIKPMFNIINILFKKIMSSKQADEETLTNIAKIAYYLYNVIPLSLGGSATTTLFLHALLKLKGFQLKPFWIGNELSSDIEAMSSTMTSYTKKFVTLYGTDCTLQKANKHFECDLTHFFSTDNRPKFLNFDSLECLATDVLDEKHIINGDPDKLKMPRFYCSDQHSDRKTQILRMATTSIIKYNPSLALDIIKPICDTYPEDKLLLSFRSLVNYLISKNKSILETNSYATDPENHIISELAFTIYPSFIINNQFQHEHLFRFVDLFIEANQIIENNVNTIKKHIKIEVKKNIKDPFYDDLTTDVPFFSAFHYSPFLGARSYRNEKYQDALTLFKNAATFEPKNIDIDKALVCTLLKLNKTDSAIPYFFKIFNSLRNSYEGRKAFYQEMIDFLISAVSDNAYESKPHSFSNRPGNEKV